MITLLDNLDGVIGIELLPQLSGQEKFYSRLQKSINSAVCLRASVAYLTIEPDFFNGAKLCSILHNGFLCVDIHLPTDINQLKLFSENNVNVYLHLRDFEGNTEIENRQMSRHLLHTKMLLFDINAEVAEIWIGSHNWTKRALLDINIEVSLILRVTTKATIYKLTVQLLESIRTKCERFDSKHTEYYRWLQKISDTEPVIEMQGNNANNIGAEIMIFFTSESDRVSLNKYGSRLYVSVVDSITHEEFIYKAEIKSRIESNNNINSIVNDLKRTRHRFAFRNKNKLLELELPLDNANNSYKNQTASTYFCLTLEIKTIVHGQIWEPVQVPQWNEVDNEFIYRHGFPNPNSIFFDNNENTYLSKLSEMISTNKFQVKKQTSLELFKQVGSKNLADKQKAEFESIINRKIIDIKSNVTALELPGL